MNPVSSMWEWATLKQCILNHITDVQQWWTNSHCSAHCKLWSITKSQISVIVTFYHENDMHRATQSWYTFKKQSRMQVKQASNHWNQQNPFSKPKRVNPSHTWITYITKLNNNSKIKKTHATSMKCYKIIRKLIPIFEEWGWNDVKMEVFSRVTQWVWECFR